MARSAEALRRRALKRQRTEEEQRKADWKDVLKQQDEKNKKKKRRLTVVEGEEIEKSRKAEDRKTNVSSKEKKQLQQQKQVRDSPNEKERVDSSDNKYEIFETSSAERSRPNVLDFIDRSKKQETTIVRDVENDYQQHTKALQQNSDGRGKDGCIGFKTERSHSPHNQKNGSNKYVSGTYQRSFHKQQQKQDHIMNDKKKKKRHDKQQQQQQQKQHSWKPQAPDDIVIRNNDLRERYMQYLASQEKKNNVGEGGDNNDNGHDNVSTSSVMSPEDIERAKILIDRSRRKQEKKLRMKEERQKRVQEKEEKKRKTKMEQSILPSNTDMKTDHQSPSFSSSSSSFSKKKKKSSDINHKAVREQNGRLRKLYQDTGGKGMEPEQIERAKMLLARDERKKLDLGQKRNRTK